MPVLLPPERTEECEPSPPNLIVWLVLLVVTMAAGAVLTLTTWPAGEPTDTLQFWVHLFVRPLMAWSAIFGLRTLYWEQECARIEADNAGLKEERRKGIRFASEPLAVLSYAYLTAAGTRNVCTILRKSDEKDASKADVGMDNLHCKPLTIAGDDDDPTRYRACFRELVSLVAEPVRALPSDLPFAIRLHLPERVERDALLESWREIWNAAQLPSAITSLVSVDRGMMELDGWLDLPGGPNLEQCVLYVSVHLRDAPSSSGAEAASAILLGWAPLARRRGVRVMALLHRPVEGDVNSFESAMADALMSGRTSVDAIEEVWQAGLGGEAKAAISKCFKQPATKGGGNATRGAIRDVAALLGDIGVACGWLAIALGTENVRQSQRPQLIICQEGTLRFAVVQPDRKEQSRTGDGV